MIEKMNESGDQQQQRVGSNVNPKIASDSGYGSNKSTQRSSGSSKSHESSVSSESSTAYPPHPNAPVSIGECPSHTSASPGQGGSAKRKGKKNKSDRKMSVGEKVDVRLLSETTKDSTKSTALSQSMEQIGGSPSSNIPSGTQQQIMSPGSKASSTHDSKALQMAALTHALSCMKKFHKPMAGSEINEENDQVEMIPGKTWHEYFSNDITVDDGCNEDNFAAVVSLEDGLIAYITPSISNILGFPRDMLVGRNFIDFVHPKDRMAFASHMTCGMGFAMGEQQLISPQSQGVNNSATTGAARVKSEPFYCRLRQYRGLKTVGFGVADKTVLYCPFKLTMTLKKAEPHKESCDSGIQNKMAESISRKVVGNEDVDISKPSSTPSGLMSNDSDSGHNKLTTSVGGGIGVSSKKSNFANSSTQNSSVHLVIACNRIKSAYQYPDEIPTNPGKFVTRHSASCHFGHMDSEAINYLGHLPQDLIGNSVLDYYHPEDMGLMKDIYEGVMHEQGKPFRSKPYRFRVYNGTFAMLETDWSCFINPWSWKLEFVIGQHRVVKGPGNPNVFMQPTDEPDRMKNVPDEIVDESKVFQNEIKKLLTEVRKRTIQTVTKRVSDPLRQQSSRRRKDLAALMETLLEGMAKTENSEKSGSQCSGMFSVMERDSVMLGEISPHHDDLSGSNQSSETPPSYNQLNYRENIERFFQSRPKTVRSDESLESSKMETNQSNRSSDSDSKCSPTIDDSSGSNIRISSNTENESGDRDMCASPLTEERLSRHNEAMEKYMIQRHRELRGKSSMTHGSHKDGRHKHAEKGEASHGVKRTGNASWDGDTHTAKQPHLDCIPGRHLPHTASPGVCCPGHNTINLWPPFSITMTPGITTPTYRSATGGGNMSGSFPGLPQCYTASRPGGEPGRNLIPETISMSATTPSAPLFFLPSQHHHHHPQFVAQQVQLFPAGVVYQPLGSCIYGQSSPLMMPGFLGTMLHPDQSMINQLESSSATTVTASQGEAIGTATLPKVSEKDKTGFARKLTNKASTANAPIITIAGLPKPGTSKFCGKNKDRLASYGVPTTPTSRTQTTTVPSSTRQHLQSMNLVGNEGSGSDESMNSASMNTNESEEKQASQSNSEAEEDQNTPWGIRKHEDPNGGSGTTTEPVGSKSKLIRKKQPPWTEKIKMTPDVMYRYKIPAVDLSDVLQKDLEALKIFGKQSSMVNDQLGMLYSELNLGGDEGFTLNLEEGMTSNSSGDENAKESEPRKVKKHSTVSSHQYCKMVILYEENAPFPPESEISVPKSEAEV